MSDNSKVESSVRTILEKYSSEENPLTQQKICEYLEKDYRIERERKSIGSTLNNLRRSGLNIKSISKKGSYIVRDLPPEAVALTLLPFICTQHISSEDRQIIVDGLCKLLPPGYEERQMSNMTKGLDAWDSDVNADMLWNAQKICDAIAVGDKVSYDYIKYVYEDGRVIASTKNFTVYPYHLLYKNNHYYLRGNCELFNQFDDAEDDNEGIIYHRLDKMRNLQRVINREGIPFDSPDNFSEISYGMPYLYADHFENIEFKAAKFLINDIIDWFGQKHLRVSLDKKADKLYVSIKASPMAMNHWAMQYLPYVEIIKPRSLRESIEKCIKQAAELYEINNE
ncbi:MAG: WYL domain-containing protein [bacterium]|nr:WYL domain-containing protein [bacterium]